MSLLKDFKLLNKEIIKEEESSFKCLVCGRRGMEFDRETHMFKCPLCENKMTKEELENKLTESLRERFETKLSEAMINEVAMGPVIAGIVKSPAVQQLLATIIQQAVPALLKGMMGGSGTTGQQATAPAPISAATATAAAAE